MKLLQHKCKTSGKVGLTEVLFWDLTEILFWDFLMESPGKLLKMDLK